MKRLLAALLLAVLALPAAAATQPPIVILLSWDGVRHDYLAWGDFPALARMQRQGARAERLTPPFPSLTFPAHVTLATGTHPDRHGIVANSFWDGSRRYRYSSDASWLEAEPLWVAAERQGVRSAVFFWVGSETDWHGLGASLRRAPFDPEVDESEKVDQLLAWLDLPEAERPRLLMCWWHGADHAGHRWGPRRAAVVPPLAEQDAHLADLMAGLDTRGLWPRTTLLVVSDHGMALATRSIDPGAALERAGIRARLELAGGAAFVYLAAPDDLERAREALAGIPEVSVYARDEIPERLRVRHPTRTGDLLLLTHPPFMFSPPSWSHALRLGLLRLVGRGEGMHGYDPELDEMGGIFLALGREVPPGLRLGRVRAVDVAPTVAALLGIDPPAEAEGHALFAPEAAP